VKGIIVAGLADLKTELATDKMMDPRIKVKILRTVDISYGMERGLQEAIVLSEDILADATLTKERKLLQSFFDEVAKPEGNYATGTREVLLTLEQSAVDLLLCWEELPILRCALHHAAKEESIVAYFTPSRKKRQPSITDLLACRGINDSTGYEMTECVPLVEWLCDNYDRFGARLEFVSNNSDEGAQFASGFGGLGAVLRYHFDTSVYDEEGVVVAADDSDEEDDFFMDEDDGGESSESEKDDSSDWDSFNAKGPAESEKEKETEPPKVAARKPDVKEQKEVPKTVPAPKKTGFNLDAPVFLPKKPTAATVGCVAPAPSSATNSPSLLAN